MKHLSKKKTAFWHHNKVCVSCLLWTSTFSWHLWHVLNGGLKFLKCTLHNPVCCYPFCTLLNFLFSKCSQATFVCHFSSSPLTHKGQDIVLILLTTTTTTVVLGIAVSSPSNVNVLISTLKSLHFIRKTCVCLCVSMTFVLYCSSSTVIWKHLKCDSLCSKLFIYRRSAWFSTRVFFFYLILQLHDELRASHRN